MVKYIFSIIFILVGCRSQFRIGTESAPDTDVRKYTSFAKDKTLFVVRSNPILNSPLTRQKIEGEIERQLSLKGYTLKPDAPDMVYSFQTHTQNKQETTTINTIPAYTWGYWGMYNNPMMYPPQTQTRNYEEATLIIDIKEKATGKLVWQGWVIGEFNYGRESFNQQISEAVGKALSRFPNKNN
jgi:hypothetical protein